VLAVLNHLWQTAVMTGLAAVAAFFLRHNSARVRHSVWCAALAKFMVPFSVLTWLGNRMHWRSLAVPPHSGARVFFEDVARPFHNTASLVLPSNDVPKIVEGAVLAVWAIGFACIVLVWWLRWHQIRATAGRGEMLPLNLPIPAVVCATPMEPGVFGVFRPVLLLPARLRDELTEPQLEALISHELCHVKSRDNLAALFQMAVESIWWFNPLVWWVGRQMRNERERAADEHVCRLTGNAHAYAEAILKVCRLCLESPVACVSGISGSNLRKRIENILHGRPPRHLGFAWRVFLCLLGTSTLAVPLAIGVANSSSARAQTPPAPQSLPAFEVVSIKRSPSDARNTFRLMPGGGITGGGITLKVLVQTAFGLAGFQVTGWPKWVFDDKFEIQARGGYNGPPTRAQTHLMMQSMLTDRFDFRYHYETKELPVYVLEVARRGPKLNPSRDDDPGLPIFKQPDGSKGEGIRGSVPVGHLTAQRADMETLAAFFRGLLGREIINRTGLNGRYDFQLDWSAESTPSRVPGVADPVPDDPRPSLFTAVQEKLGLRLEDSKGPVQTLVIETVGEPSEN
jgi:uncharacterized protein (TIGR03435 family)